MQTAQNVINQESLTTDKEWSPSLASSKQLPTTKISILGNVTRPSKRSFERPKQCTLHIRYGNVTLRSICECQSC